VVALRRRRRDPLLDLARYRSGFYDLAVVRTTQAVDLARLAQALGCWYLVDHAGLEEGRPKTVFAVCDQRKLEDVLAGLQKGR
jgi:hypothetical protein